MNFFLFHLNSSFHSRDVHLHFKVFLTIYMHQFGWFSERGRNFLNLFQKEGVPSEMGGGGSNPGGNYGDKIMAYETFILIG